jgi:hypothetical protein
MIVGREDFKGTFFFLFSPHREAGLATIEGVNKGVLKYRPFRGGKGLTGER